MNDSFGSGFINFTSEEGKVEVPSIVTIGRGHPKPCSPRHFPPLA